MSQFAGPTKLKEFEMAGKFPFSSLMAGHRRESAKENDREYQIASLPDHPAVSRAFAFIDRSAAHFTAEQIRICEIPAPPFGEKARGEYLAGRFTSLGLRDVHTDEIGNVIGIFPGASADPLIAVSAHLDTVFPAGTDVTVRRVGSRLCAPGIGDDVAGLTALVALAETLKESGIRLRGSLAFVATVGEEGEGDLRGVRHLFGAGSLARRISAFVTIDGTGTDWVTHAALGSRRYRIRLDGPGGHSWGDFGVVNPVHALGRIAARLADYPAPHNPRTTYNIGRIEGGESVNVIPSTATMDVDLRSTSEAELSRVEEFLLDASNRAIAAENSLRAATGRPLRQSITLIGARPSGAIPSSAPIVTAAVDVGRALGIRTVLNCASTDANIPISLGIPAIAIGAGGISGDPHRLTEWYDPRGRETGCRRVLLLALALAGLDQ